MLHQFDIQETFHQFQLYRSQPQPDARTFRPTFRHHLSPFYGSVSQNSSRVSPLSTFLRDQHPSPFVPRVSVGVLVYRHKGERSLYHPSAVLVIRSLVRSSYATA